MLHPDIESVLLSSEELAEINRRLGEQITRDYEGRNPLVVAVLRGAVVFVADLIREIKTAMGIDFMAVSSYGSGVKSSGVVRILKDLDTEIEGRDVIIVEDILDSGLTLSYLIDMLKSRGPNSVAVCTLTVKDIPGKTPAITPDYVGVHVPDEFIVGYGLDYDERYRNLPYIGILKPEVYEK